MIVTDYALCDIHLPNVQAAYERPCSYIEGPGQTRRWTEQAFVFFPDPDTRVLLYFKIDSVTGILATNILYYTVAKRDENNETKKQFTSRNASCYVRNGKPACFFTMKDGTSVDVVAK